MRQLARALVLTMLGLLILPVTALAATPATIQTPAEKGSINGLAISPALQQFVLSPAQDKFTFTIQLYNYTDQPLTLQLSAADFTSSNQAGGLEFLNSQATSVQKSHGLSSFITTSPKMVTLAPNTAQQLPVTIGATNQLASGGHYAAILARAAAPAGTASNRIASNQVVSSLVFVETAGQGTKSMRALPLSVSKLSFSLPSSLDVFFEATGNTQVTPRGIVSIDRQLHAANPTERGVINTNSSLLLPGSTRVFTTPLKGNQRPWWPGIYHVDLQYRYDGSVGISQYQTSFLYINPVAIVVILVTLTLIIFLVTFVRRKRKRRTGGKLPNTTASEVKVTKKVTIIATANSLVDPLGEHEPTPSETEQQ